jgi:hypothetical protein
LSVAPDPVFGPSIHERHVQYAVRDTIQLWIETYLAAVERREGMEPREIPVPDPGNYVLKDDGTLNKRPEDALPAVLILCPGTAGPATVEGQGSYGVPFVVNVAAIVSSGDPAYVSDLAKHYTSALRDLLVHNGSLGGFAQTSAWKGSRTDDLRPEDDRSMAAGVNVFHIYVKDVVRRGAGLKAPPEDPYEELELPTIKEVEVDLKPEEIK